MGKRRVVVTGLGAITPVGSTVEETWKNILNGISGVGKITQFDTEKYSTKIAAEVKNYDPLNYFEKKEARKLDRFAQFAIIAAREAVEKSGIDFEQENRDRVGVIIGSGIGGMNTFQTEFEKLLTQGPRRVSPHFIPQLISDIVSGHVSIMYNLKGPNYATTSACATSGHSIGLGMRTIQYGDADMMICGGAEAAVNEMGVSGFSNMKAISTQNDTPELASRPFDLDRDGFVIGEGAGVVVLEELEHAKARGARIYAEAAGIGFTGDAFHVTQPAPGGEGAVRAMRLCIEDAGLTLDDVDYINAHGTSTPFNDRNETEAIKTLFGRRAYDLKISSSKSMTGHLLGAAGAVELILSSLAIQDGKIPPTANYRTPDPDCDLDYVPNTYIDAPVRVAISNSFGFGGHNACLCVKAADFGR